MSRSNEVTYALIKLKQSVTYKKSLLEKGGLYPFVEEDLQLEVNILETAIKEIKEKFEDTSTTPESKEKGDKKS